MMPKVSNLEKKNAVRVNVRPAANAVPIQMNTPTPTMGTSLSNAKMNIMPEDTIVQTYPREIKINEPQEFSSNNPANALQNGGKRSKSRRAKLTKRKHSKRKHSKRKHSKRKHTKKSIGSKKLRRTRYNARRNRNRK